MFPDQTVYGYCVECEYREPAAELDRNKPHEGPCPECGGPRFKTAVVPNDQDPEEYLPREHPDEVVAA